MAVEPASRIEGFIEDISAQKVSGWAWEVGSDQALVLEVFADGMRLGQTRAERFRNDLRDGGKGTGQHAFDFVFETPSPAFLRPGAVTVQVAGRDRVLAPTETLTRRLGAPAPAAAVIPAEARPAGATGRIVSVALEGATLRGSALLPPGSVAVTIAVDGTAVGQAAVGPRGDGVPDTAPQSFALVMDAELFDGDSHRIACFDAATGRRLEGGTVMLRFPAQPDAQAEPAPVLPPAALPPAPRPEPPIAAVKPRAVIIGTGNGAGEDARAAWLATLCASAGTLQPERVVVQAGSAPGGADRIPVDLPSLMVQAARLAEGAPCAAVIVTAPSFASLLLGGVLRSLCQCPLLVDLDDAALPAAPGRAAPEFSRVEMLLRDALTRPGIDPAAERSLVAALIGFADGILVGTPAARRRGGGMVVRQGRDEAAFDPAQVDRAARRAAFGLTEADRVIVLFGDRTPAQDVLPVAEALERLRDPGLVLCVIGAITDETLRERLAGLTAARIMLRDAPPGVPLPALLAIADCIPVLLAGGTALVASVPPLLVDALALGVPILASPSLAVEDLVVAGAVQPVATAAQLDAALRSLATTPPGLWRRRGAREVYLGEFGRRVNALRLGLALAPLSGGALPMQPQWPVLFRILRRLTGVKLPGAARARGAGGAARPAPDLVVLGSDNAFDLPGGRASHIAQRLLETGRVRRIVQFDAPLSAARLEALAAGREGDPVCGGMIYAQTAKRVLGLADTPNVIRRTFLHRSGRRPRRMMGRDLPPAAEYADFLRTTLRAAGVETAPLLLVCAGVADYAMVRAVIGPSLVIADLDAARFPDDAPDPSAAIARWSGVVTDADVVVCNAAALIERFAALRSDIELVPDPPEVDHLWRAVEQAG